MITEYPKFTTKTVGGVEIVTVKNLGQAFGSYEEIGRLIGKSKQTVRLLIPRLKKTHHITMLRDDRGATTISIPEFYRAFIETHQYTQEQ